MTGADATEAERRLWARLRNRGLGAKFRREVAVGPYRVDFQCKDAALVVEVDGGQHNGSARDAVRTAFLERCGWRVIRFWNNEVLENTEGVLMEIQRVLEEQNR